jgi:hypothetical protein
MQRDKGTKGQREEGKDAKAQRDKGTKGQREEDKEKDSRQ